MSILKLEPGQKVLFTVTEAVEVKGNFGPQVRFTSDAGDALFLNIDTATKQLGRIGLTPETVIGVTVEFERIEKNGTKYTNINKPGAAKLAFVAGMKEAVSLGGPLPYEQSETGAPPEVLTVGDKLTKVFQVYDVCFDHAHSLAKRTLGNDCTHEGIAAQAATLFIQAAQRGVFAA